MSFFDSVLASLLACAVWQFLLRLQQRYNFLKFLGRILEDSGRTLIEMGMESNIKKFLMPS